jgi:hypothetical protein
VSVLKRVKQFILESRAAGADFEALHTDREMEAALRQATGTPEGQPVVVEGVPIRISEGRDKLMVLAASYAWLRWRQIISKDDMAVIFHAVPDGELDMIMLSLILDQYMDERNFEDPLEDADHRTWEMVRDALKELGFEFIEI